MDRNPTTARRPAFTLVELLVVVAVIAILIGVLLPALAGARNKGQLIVSIQKMRDLTVAAQQYSYENDRKWPVVPAVEPPEGPYVTFTSWHFGGATTDAYWQSSGRGQNFADVGERPLNPYIYPDLDLRDPPDGGRLELDAFRCPSDRSSLQRGYRWLWHENIWEITPSPNESSYEDVGTSYHMNVRWAYAPERPNENSIERWARTESEFGRGGVAGPGGFVWLHDEILDAVVQSKNTFNGLHGGRNRAKAAFMDGHVKYLTVEPGAEITGEYALLLERPLDPDGG